MKLVHKFHFSLTFHASFLERNVMAKNLIIFERHSNENYRTYYPSVRISYKRRNYFESPAEDMAEEVQQILNDIGKIGELVVIGILSIDGVCSVQISPIDIGITKSPAYSWDDIHQEVITVLKCAIWQINDIRAPVEVRKKGDEMSEDVESAKNVKR